MSVLGTATGTAAVALCFAATGSTASSFVAACIAVTTLGARATDEQCGCCDETDQCKLLLHWGISVSRCLCSWRHPECSDPVGRSCSVSESNRILRELFLESIKKVCRNPDFRANPGVFAAFERGVAANARARRIRDRRSEVLRGPPSLPRPAGECSGGNRGA